MQYPEFGTQVGRLKSLWLTLLGMTGLGQGASRNLLAAAAIHKFRMSFAAISMSSAVTSMRSSATDRGRHIWHPHQNLQREEPDWLVSANAMCPCHMSPSMQE